MFATYYLLPMMAALWSSSHEDVLSFPATSLIEFMCNHRMLQLFDRPVYQTPAGRSIEYTGVMARILGDGARTRTPIVSLKKFRRASTGLVEYELFTTDGVSVGTFDHVIFACHSPQAARILESNNIDAAAAASAACDDNNDDTALVDRGLIDALRMIEYGDNVVYVHSDPRLMPTRKCAWGAWNCMGKSSLLASRIASRREGEAMEGYASGFGNRLTSSSSDDDVRGDVATVNGDGASLEGEDGRMRAVYVMYHLNRLQNLKMSTDVFVSLNPHVPPKSELVYRRQIMAHPQFNVRTHAGRSMVRDLYQGKSPLRPSEYEDDGMIGVVVVVVVVFGASPRSSSSPPIPLPLRYAVPLQCILVGYAKNEEGH